MSAQEELPPGWTWAAGLPVSESRGRIVVETCSAAGEVLSTRYIRCICTDFVCGDSATNER